MRLFPTELKARAGWVAFALFVLFPTLIYAIEAQVSLETVGQAYQLRRTGLMGTAMLDRRRLTQMMRLSLYDLYPRQPGSPTHVYFVSSMRFDTDLGSYLGEAFPATDRIPELHGTGSLGRFELLHATLVAERLGGWVDVVLGRQILFDLYDFFSFDGGTARVHLPWHVAVEALAGTEVRGSSPLASPIYELDGTSVGSAGAGSCYQLALGISMARGCPSLQEMVSPTYGFAVETEGLPWLQARVAYRRTQSGTPQAVPGLPDSGVRDEKVWATLSLLWGPFRPYGGLRYSLLHGMIDQADAGLRTQLGGHSLGLQYLFSSPTFDGDSIFNVFASQPIDDLRLTFTTKRFGLWRFWAATFARFTHDLAQTLRDQRIGAVDPFGMGVAAGASGGLQRQLSGRGYVRIDGYFDDGFGGRRGGGDTSWRIELMDVRWNLEGRMTLVYFEPDVGAGASGVGRSAVSFGMQTGVRYALAEQAQLHLLFENNHNRYYPYQLRMLGVLEVGFWR